MDSGMGTISAAVGFQYRDTLFESVPDSLEAAGEANEEGISAEIVGDQDVVAYFAEVIVPFNDLAELQLAVRHEDYGSGVNTTDPKASFSIDATEWLTLRGSYGTSFLLIECVWGAPKLWPSSWATTTTSQFCGWLSSSG